ncbi:formyltransferase family protein [Polaribacter sp. 11A2H]|uniref:formyltransferase family protein n=1 Tax=Polaribacter sp. 11A2H TaxID=2687290 RepID=UPI001409101D|nr:formyltransferase family protein [Polaribacter sp. 11A2H]
MVTLYLMTKKGFDTLNYLIASNLDKYIAEVVVGEDLDVLNDYSKDIKLLCKNHKISFKKRTDFFESEAKYAIAISWKWLINNIDQKLIVLHDSLLPKYRGFAPLVNALINNENKVGVTALWATQDYDKGAVILQRSLNVNYPKKIENLINEVSSLYKEIVAEIICKLVNSEKLSGKKQEEDLSTYSLWRDEEDYLIDWTLDADVILRFVNAVSYPYKGASTFINNNKYRITKVDLIEDVEIENRAPGKVIFIKEEKPVVVCGKGLLKINNLLDVNDNNILPLKSFRVRFKGVK